MRASFGWVSLWLVACGGKDDEGTTTPGDAVRDACVAQCEGSSVGEGCDTDAVLAECSDLCAFATLMIPTECYDVSVAASECQAGLDYECTGLISVNDVDWPIPVDSSACAAEIQALSECQGMTPTTTP